MLPLFNLAGVTAPASSSTVPEVRRAEREGRAQRIAPWPRACCRPGVGLTVFPLAEGAVDAMQQMVTSSDATYRFDETKGHQRKPKSPLNGVAVWHAGGAAKGRTSC